MEKKKALGNIFGLAQIGIIDFDELTPIAPEIVRLCVRAASFEVPEAPGVIIKTWEEKVKRTTNHGNGAPSVEVTNTGEYLWNSRFYTEEDLKSFSNAYPGEPIYATARDRLRDALNKGDDLGRPEELWRIGVASCPQIPSRVATKTSSAQP